MDSAEQTSLFTPLTQPYDSMVHNAQSLRRISDRGVLAVWSAGNLKKQLMLLRLKTEPPGRLLAELKKYPKVMTKVRKHPEPCIRS